MEKTEALRQYFGYESFHPGQETLIDAVLSGRDALGVMPTGGGKSLCYQLPALLLPGITVVISPLISLMKDQVMALKNMGIPAAFINSTLSPEQLRAVYKRVREGMYRLVYVAPERLGAPGFAAVLRERPVSLLAVDEAHCISQWGQDFRPSYLRITDFIEALPRRPVVAAYTATATTRVRNDIRASLALRDPVTVVTGFDRPNLRFDVLRPKRKNEALLRLMEAKRGQSGIVYCATRKNVEAICQLLLENGYSATRYHAGLEDEERRQNQEDFICDRSPVIVATNAFGMGIDKSNVSFVIHYNMPKSLEAYYQEAGRAGRDGSAADCVLLFSAGDVQTAKYLIENAAENEELTPEERQTVQEEELRRLNAMVGYCKTAECLRGYLLDYFGQKHPPRCGNCGTCESEYLERDITREAQMILSCIRRVQEQLGYSVGQTMICAVLRGGRSARLLQLGLDRLPTYGLLRQTPRAELGRYLEAMEAEGVLQTEPAHQTLEWTTGSREVLFAGRQVCLRLRQGDETARAERAQKTERGELFEALRVLRFRLAQEAGVPAYVIFSNTALRDMAVRAPLTMEEFLRVSGVGRVKAERYGEVFLQEIRCYLAENPA